ncbi:type IX secretion system periplasmic lipoprotein PorW/SprE [Roseivirga echinicomitans]
MKFRFLHIAKFFGLLAITSLFIGCNSKAYQNMNARYNGYFYANQYLNEVNQQIEDSYQYNYDQILKIYPDIDSSIIQSNQNKLDDAFKKASQVIEWYGTSDWTDDNYLIIGKIRHLRAQFQFAIETLQYINQTSEDDPTRHASLIALMQTYMDAGEKEKAKEVSDYLETEELNDENTANYKVMLAYFHQREEDYEAMAANLKEVAEIVSKKDTKTRINFILGQIEQGKGQNAEAYKYYKAALDGTPPYELAFHAKLNMQQVSAVNGAAEIEKVRKFYAQLLKDGKNKEYQGKIYFEMGEFEKKQNHYDLAIDNYMKAVAVETPLPRQQSLSYLRVGQLYFDIYERFELASSYYDSAVNIMPNDIEGYADHVKRKEVLTDFVTQLNIIQVNDSLLSLAELPAISLDAFVDNYLAQQEKLAKAREKEDRQNTTSTGAVISPSIGGGFASTTPSSEWYFYNDAAVELGTIEFQRRWGTRKLEDNWRRSSKETFSTSEIEEEDIIAESDDPLPEVVPANEAQAALKKELLANVPTTPEAKEKLQIETQDAYFKLGSVYRFGLEKEAKAAGTYKTLLQKYPNTAHKLDALFALYTLYAGNDPSQAQGYKQQIIGAFPESLIAKTLINPNYLAEKEARNRALQNLYASAYTAYENGEYIKADQMLQDALQSFKDVDFLPTVELLSAILKGKTESLFSYEEALKAFVAKYPEGRLTNYAKDLLIAVNPIKESIVKSEGFEYSEDFKQLHLLVIVYNTEVTSTAELKTAIESFNQGSFAHLKLSVGQLVFDESKKLGIMFINSFEDKKTVEAYHRAFKNALADFTIEVDSNFNNFAISRDNFQMLFQTKALEPYLQFHNTFYQ